MNTFNKVVKRIFDLICSTLGLIVLSPILIVIAIRIKTDSDGPVFFKQIRIGEKNKEFEILKFRTMVVDAEKLGRQITVGNDSRITKIGAFLRKYKLDELPQLINVFKGDMSLVGPRPEVPRYVKMYNEEQRRVLEVKPGITDLASIRYRDENDLLGEAENPDDFYINTIMPDKLALNLEYINKNNIFLDIYIILKTIVKCI
ncbi:MULTISPECIES: sugar transferase [Clostridium]|jgi:Sugar transferases involved in lipopolysaccharide synthesis|uniref:Lipopolysaccharide/colanic/teichoic acid biosynthesis glycosyltransferase n=2 Tax=Clostridium beijerinckii TaxID=1520 RepID=A0A1S8PKF2_CLOBE|nr:MULTISPECIES: sugar transferase [Clostridium]ABR36728.1 sugar transferase [Clostridium beijerinckii NCIMB 8052]AIU03895.1 sugar transferase [Clostridium beijerinckii ATCC 35702]MBF7808625.1 sugar transferase [Clostridium beijerinckii]NOW89102.1 lipopolysaccharide/colanic/teichoic acid biosynthesis glycosyltransferase [Clostridium beijerinckii]NRT22197.1 lipopolysaccharide/colanic/teichoic acid biosynthesis glycosyltransferase [Clostridium beijerinckii]